MNLIDWDEANFAEVSREMIESGNYLKPTVNFEPFHEKPPLFFWLQSGAMHLFGVNEFAARFPGALCGVVTLLLIFSIGRRLYNDNMFALIWVAVWLSSYLPHFYFKSGIIDPAYNLFTFLAIYSLIRCAWDHRVGKRRTWRWVFLAGLFTALAVLTKGPAVFAIVVLVVLGHTLVSRGRLPMPALHLGVYFAVAAAVTAVWLGIQFSAGETETIREFFAYQWRLIRTAEAGHDGFPGYHVLMLLFGAFPASVLAFGVIGVKRSHRQTRADFAKWMHVLLVVVILIFSIVKTKVVHYTSLAYFPITFLAALTLYRAFTGRRFNRGLKIGLATSMGVAALVLLLAPFIMSQREWVAGLTSDSFTQAVLLSEVKWSVWTYGPGLLLLGLTLVTISLWLRRLRKAWIYTFLAAMPLTVMISIIVFAPKVEHYMQRPAISFFKALEGKDVFLTTYGFKSYSDEFYAKVGPGSVTVTGEEVLSGPITKDAYIVSRVDLAGELRGRTDIEELRSEGGFVFFRRPRPGMPL